MKQLPNHIRRFIARAGVGLETMSMRDREEHFQAIVDLIAEDTVEAELASSSLAHMRAAMRQQREFTDLLNSI